MLVSSVHFHTIRSRWHEDFFNLKCISIKESITIAKDEIDEVIELLIKTKGKLNASKK